MNERLKALAAQQGLVGPNIYVTQQELEQFAELIVRECAGICDALQDIPATEPRHCAEDIRIHFGVQE